jgi:hypothetical protein
MPFLTKLRTKVKTKVKKKALKTKNPVDERLKVLLVRFGQIGMMERLV